MADLAFSEAFAKYGAKLKNVQWSVCADAPDGALVVSLWQDLFEPPKDGSIFYRGSFSDWSGPGNSEFRVKVTHAFNTNQNINLVISRVNLLSGSKSNAFNIKPDWIGKVTSIIDDEYEFKFSRI